MVAFIQHDASQRGWRREDHRIEESSSWGDQVFQAVAKPAFFTTARVAPGEGRRAKTPLLPVTVRWVCSGSLSLWKKKDPSLG
jgi:hypothetical protein